MPREYFKHYTERLILWIDKETKLKAEQSARGSHISLAQFVRNAIDHYIKWIRGE